MNRRLLAALAAITVTTVACGSATQQSQPSYVEARNVAMARPGDDLDLKPFTAATRGFGFALAKQLADQAQGGNLVYSPLSLAVALSMVREGARGETAAEMDRVLQYPENRSKAFNALIRSLRGDSSDGNTVEVNDGVFVDPRLQVRASYLAALKKWYDAGVFETAFPSPALDDINAYVKSHTHGRIPHLLDDLDPAALMALVNTVYLKAAWALPFNPTETDAAPFTTADGTRVSVQTMSRTGDIDYASGPGWQAVRLPYRGDRLSMWVLLPAQGKQPLPLLSPRVLDQASMSFTPTDLHLELPRWDASSTLDLMRPLTNLGLRDLMGPAPDLAGISKDGGLYVAQAVQQANITVGERGTVAAAATAMVIAGSAMVDPPTVVRVDHPFAYVIMDNATGTPLFEGVESDPS